MKQLHLELNATKEVNYYDVGGITTLNVIKAKLTKEQYQGYLLGNIIKYSHRLNWKDSTPADAKKLYDYSTWLLEELKNV